MAIDRMGKNKAAAADELLDVIFQVREWKKLENTLKQKEEFRKNWKDEVYINSMEYKPKLENPKNHNG